MEVSHEDAILKLSVQEKVLEQSSSKIYRPTRIKCGRRYRSIGSVEARIPQQHVGEGRSKDRVKTQCTRAQYAAGATAT